MYPIPDTLQDLTRELVSLRKKPGTQERFKSYPAMLQRFMELLETCTDAATLKEVLRLDEGYYLLAGYRQRVIEKLLTFERTPAILRAYALQLELFGDVDDYGEANTAVEERVNDLFAEADQLEQNQ